MVVERDRVPCAVCWLNCREQCAPGAAYRFTHPDPVGNAAPGDLDTMEREGLLDEYEDQCVRVGFRPVEESVEVVWPPPPGSPPPLPPFQTVMEELLRDAGLSGFEAQKRLVL